MRTRDKKHWLNYALESAIKENKACIETLLTPTDCDQDTKIAKERLAQTFEQQIANLQKVRADLNAPRHKRRFFRTSKTTVL